MASELRAKIQNYCILCETHSGNCEGTESISFS